MSSVFILGATGYIGGAVLVCLKQHRPDFDITALVRNPSQNDAILAAGATKVVNTVPDTLKMLDIFETIASDVDIIVNCATMHEIEPVQAMLRGLKKRFESGKGRGIYIATSGTALFSDRRTDGKFDPDGKTYSDLSEEDMKSIPAEVSVGKLKFHRPEGLLVKAAEEGYLLNYTIIPAGVVGRSAGPVGQVGMFEHIIGAIKDIGQPFYIGEGSSINGTVYISDLADLYILALQKAIADRNLANPKEGPHARYYFASVTNFACKESIAMMGEILLERGVIKSAEPKQVEIEQAGFFGPFFAGNALVTSERGIHDLGWRPKQVTIEMIIETIEESIKANR